MVGVEVDVTGIVGIEVAGEVDVEVAGDTEVAGDAAVAGACVIGTTTGACGACGGMIIGPLPLPPPLLPPPDPDCPGTCEVIVESCAIAPGDMIIL
jgi:hypothetical protein